jgi:hypothetical protein
MRLRISLALVTLLAAITALTVGLGSAAATTATLPDPQTTNVPYVAWVGEQVKVVKCLDSEESDVARTLSINSLIFSAKFSVEAWSGDPAAQTSNAGPKFLNDNGGNVVASFSRNGDLCFSIHVTSQDPGMAVIKLAVRDDFLTLFPGADP